MGATEQIEFFGEPGRDPVVIVDYDPAWPEAFAHFAGLLRNALDSTALRIDHVGSTAVPGLSAKPVIDIQISVADVSDEPAYRRAIESLGLGLRNREPHNLFFRPPSGEKRTVHVHVCGSGSAWEREHLLFVAYMREHPDRASAYAALKRELAAEFGADRVGYTSAKDAFIAETMHLAERWANTTGWQP